jgi:hypothetical protein
MTLKLARLKVTPFAKCHASDKTALVGCVRQIITLSNSNGYLPTGCHTTIVETSIIPDSIGPGTYYLDMVLRYPINPFRTEVVHYRTNEFEVVK